MQNKENKLFHKVSHRCIWVIQALTFGINLSNFRYYLHCFQCTIIFRTCNIIFHSPSTMQIQILRNSIFSGFIWSIICNHQILKVTKEQREKCKDRASLWIIVKIFYYLICLENITVHYRVAKFESVKIFTHSDLLLHNFRCHSPIIFFQ